MMVEWADSICALPTYNFREGTFKFAKQIDGQTAEKIRVGRQGCPNCNARCGIVVKDAEGGNAEVDYENITMLGSNIGINANPAYGNHWWGEGEVKLYMDGDTDFPTICGTGTEDYFNTSWCPKTLYTHPYFGYARVNDDIGWMGRTHVYRFHISDPIYFSKSLRATIEHGHADNLTLDLASVAYWYQAPPLSKLAPIPDKEARRPKSFIGVTDIHRWRHEWRKNQGGDDQLWGNER